MTHTNILEKFQRCHIPPQNAVLNLRHSLYNIQKCFLFRKTTLRCFTIDYDVIVIDIRDALLDRANENVSIDWKFESIDRLNHALFFPGHILMNNYLRKDYEFERI